MIVGGRVITQSKTSEAGSHERTGGLASLLLPAVVASSATTPLPERTRKSSATSGPPPIEVPLPDHLPGSKWDGSAGADGSQVADALQDDANTVLTAQDIEEEEDEEARTLKGKIKKFLKILVPHVILLVILLGYLSLGAVVLTKMESELETSVTRNKMTKLKEMYEKIIDETWTARAEREEHSPLSQENWTRTMKSYLHELGRIHVEDFDRQMEIYPMVETKWTFPTALLNALTLLSACGYGVVMPKTDFGQLFAVAFTLLGIPLMFITAADIGKFLSECIITLLELSKTCYARLHICLRTKKGKILMQQEEDLLAAMEGGFFEGAPEALQKLWMPILIYVSVISAYCCLGSLMFRNWEPTWSFMHAFHFGFNLIVTVGLGDIVVSDPVFLCLLVCFVIVGLSVVTMCVDLASTHLKAYFTRIHYFGRAQRFLDMSDDIRNMMEYLAWMRRTKGGHVTWQDVRELMESIRLGSYNPRGAAKWRWIDETTSSCVSTLNRNPSLMSQSFSNDLLRRFGAGQRASGSFQSTSDFDFRGRNRSRSSQGGARGLNMMSASQMHRPGRELKPWTEETFSFMDDDEHEDDDKRSWLLLDKSF